MESIFEKIGIMKQRYDLLGGDVDRVRRKLEKKRDLAERLEQDLPILTDDVQMIEKYP